MAKDHKQPSMFSAVVKYIHLEVNWCGHMEGHGVHGNRRKGPAGEGYDQLHSSPAVVKARVCQGGEKEWAFGERGVNRGRRMGGYGVHGRRRPG